MNRTIVLCSYNRPIQEPTRKAIQQMMAQGAAYMTQTGSADVTLARNLALSGGCRALRQLNALRAKQAKALFDTFLMVDDDMQFEVHQAQRLIDHTRIFRRGASAMYATLHGTIAAARIDTPVSYDAGTLAALKSTGVQPQHWVTGLGLLAIPSCVVLELEEHLPKFLFPDLADPARPEIQNTQFTQSGAVDGKWWSEDYTLCKNLGGVHLLPIPVGHLKTIPIFPDAETVRKIRDGERFDDEAAPPDVLGATPDADH